MSALAGTVGRRVSFLGEGLPFERHRGHDGQTGLGRSLGGDQGLSQPAERLSDDEVDPALGVELELPVEQCAHAFVWFAILGLVDPREAEVSGDERVALVGDLARHCDRGAVDVVDLAGQPDGGQLVFAGVEGERLQYLRSGAHELPVELRERFGMREAHLGGEGTRLDISPFLQLEKITAVPEHHPVRQPFQQTFGHPWLLA